MSSFICDTKTFQDVYSGMRIYGASNLLNFELVKRKTSHLIDYAGKKYACFPLLQGVMAELYYLNVKAVNERYKDSQTAEMTNKYIDSICKLNAHISIYQFLKSLECLHYQMSEGDVPNEPIYKMVEDLINAVCYSIVHSSDEYEKARWG